MRDSRLALVLAAACWGAGTAVSKQAVAEVPPLTLLPAQLATSLGFLLLVRWLSREPGLLAQVRRPVGWLGVLNPGLAYGLSLVGLTMISASLSVLLWAAEPILILLLAALILRERITTSLVVLSGIALGGLGIVLYDPAATGALAGILLSLAGIGCCVLYTIATRRWLPDIPSALAVVIAQELYGLAVAGIVVLGLALGGAAVLPTSLSSGALASVLVSGVTYYGLAYVFYLRGLRHLPASTAAVSFYLIPLFGIIAATAFGERLQPVQWVGASIVIAAVIVVGWQARAIPTASSAEPSARRPGSNGSVAARPGSSL